MTAMTKREYDNDDSARVKRVKTESNGEAKMDAASNPYLAHWNDSKDASATGGGLQGMKRHATGVADSRLRR